MLHDDRMNTLAKLLDVANLRAQVHAGNIANVDTPGYRAQAVAFESAFQDALAGGDQDQALAVEPEVYQPRDTALKMDGNDVDLDREITLQTQNNLLYTTYVNLLRGKHRLLNTAITGGN
jgi:flagellar basal-body rod protein FlgB